MNWKRIAIGGGIVAGLIGAGVLFTATQSDIGTEQLIQEGASHRAQYSEIRDDIVEYKETHPSWNVDGHADYWRTNSEGSRLFYRSFEIRESFLEPREVLYVWVLQNCAGRPTPTHLQARRDPRFSQYVSGRGPDPLQYITPEAGLLEECTVARAEYEELWAVGKEIREMSQ